MSGNGRGVTRRCRSGGIFCSQRQAPRCRGAAVVCGRRHGEVGKQAGPSSGDAQDRGGAERCRSAMAELAGDGSGARCPAGHQAAHARAAAGQVPRPRLTARLDEGLARGLVLVCAPAGYGKTVLLADWTRRGGQPAGLALAGRGGQRPGPVLAPRGGRARPGPPRDRRTGGPAARAARAVVVPGAGHGADQRPGRGPGPAGPRRLPRDRLARRCTSRSRSWSSTGRPGYAWCWPAAATRRCRWRGCGHAAS